MRPHDATPALLADMVTELRLARVEIATLRDGVFECGTIRLIADTMDQDTRDEVARLDAQLVRIDALLARVDMVAA